MAIADRHGLPVAVHVESATPHEVTLVKATIAQRLVLKRPAHLVGDAAYESDQLDAELAQRGIELIAPHRRDRKRKTQDGRPLRRYRRRWRWNGYSPWLQNYRHVVVRYERHAENFLGNVQPRLLPHPAAVFMRRLKDVSCSSRVPARTAQGVQAGCEKRSSCAPGGDRVCRATGVREAWRRHPAPGVVQPRSDLVGRTGGDWRADAVAITRPQRAQRNLCAYALACNERKSTPSSRSCSRSTLRRDLMSGMTRRMSFARLRPTAASIRPSFT